MANGLVDLTLNLGAGEVCNPGGSTICMKRTEGCGTVGTFTCITKSVKPAPSLESVSTAEMAALQKEINSIIEKMMTGG